MQVVYFCAYAAKLRTYTSRNSINSKTTTNKGKKVKTKSLPIKKICWRKNAKN